MKILIPLSQIRPADRSRTGAKGVALASLSQAGFSVPKTFCLAADTYTAYVDSTGLRERILLELNRKSFAAMRWEEIWDASLRIRNFFLTTALPSTMAQKLEIDLLNSFGDVPTVIRSSGLGEDEAGSSFAGLHESYVNVKGVVAMMDHIRLVWASLWSDAALLYRQELRLDPASSAMAVIVQELADGDCSGVFFGVNPNDDTQSVLEAVYGLNQGLVDGEIMPDRWLFDRQNGRLLDHQAASRRQRIAPGDQGTAPVALGSTETQQPPLTAVQAQAVYRAGMRAEALFGAPQDLEWTFCRNELVILQSRPVTTAASIEKNDQRGWYLSLHRSFDNLKRLQTTIIDRYLPEMTAAADGMQQVDLSALSDETLAAEIRRRKSANDHWVKIYWSDFIPFAHGMRLFGQIYNDTVRPGDPYEFMRLIERSELKSIERNRLLEKMAQGLRKDSQLAQLLKSGQDLPREHPLARELDLFVQHFGDLSCPVSGGTQCQQGTSAIIRIVLEMAAHPPKEQKRDLKKNVGRLREKFLAGFEGQARQHAEDLLELGRASYRLRDDDNIYLGRIETCLFAALSEGRRRVAQADAQDRKSSALAEMRELLQGFEESVPPPAAAAQNPPQKRRRVRPRQIVGQPGGPGLTQGRARVIRQQDDLMDFKHGEILVCDAVDPNMTFIVPLATGIVERRGGMLIHGAIIAREYGIPCVTGVPDAIDRIQSGDALTVDGFLGIVTIGTNVI